MAQELTIISPEGLEVANSYLEFGTIDQVCKALNITENVEVEVLNKREIKKYIDTIFLDTGYRNRNKIAEVMDTIIESKLEEALDTEQYSNKDLADLIQMAHKIRMDELRYQDNLEKTSIKNQTNVQINEAFPLGEGNWGALVKEIMSKEQ